MRRGDGCAISADCGRRQASNHSLWQASRPRRDIMVSFWQVLIWPNTGSTICALGLQSARPRCWRIRRIARAAAGSLARPRCLGRDTLLRLVRALPDPQPGLVPLLGVDDELVEYARPANCQR
jgi:hypothetical protein